MFSDSNLSVVISGPVLGTEEDRKKYTREACESARRVFRNAEIVFSTWIGEDVDELDFDKIIFNRDPGPNSNENTNRQICSRLAGLRGASREYVLAMRSDSIIVNTNFTKYIDIYTKHGTKYQFLNYRVVIPASYPASRGGLFHIGDWYFFGHKEDLIKIWDIPYMDDNLFLQGYEIVYNPHRYLITAFIRKYHEFSFRLEKDINEENQILYESVLAENFVITGFYEYGIVSLKYPLTGTFFNRLFHKEVGYSFEEWKELYNRYSGGNEKIKKSLSERFMLGICVPLKRTRVGKLFMDIRMKLFKLNYWE